MAGKSVFIRQVALIVLMAQMGSFVPAEAAQISLVDRIFVRSGASDMITSGLSTFMVEMVEAANILHHATSKSLIIMDEIGRGTSTYDGISIAWSIAEYLVQQAQSGAKTLFATHYHELQELAVAYPHKIQNYHMAIQDDHGEPVFLYQCRMGGASHSFGVAVAKLAGLPVQVVEQAKQRLAMLETNHRKGEDSSTPLPLFAEQDQDAKQLSIPLLEKLRKLDVMNMTPIEALEMLAKLKEEAV